MKHYSLRPRDRICVKAYGFLPFAKNMGRNIGKNTSKTLSIKYSQKIFHHAKQSAIDTIKTASKRAIQKTAVATGDFICNKIADRITKVSKTSPKRNLEMHEEEILSERFIPQALRHKIIDDLRLKEQNYWLSII